MKPYQTLFTGKPLLEFDTIDSTNRYATELLSKSNPSEGTAIYTRYQSEGRGQIGRKWEGEAGKNVAVSVVLYPGFLEASFQFSLNIVVSLAVRDIIRDLIPEEMEVSVKWPNDIYVGKKKIAGILIQNTLSGKNIKSSVVGIGINVNQDDFHVSIPNPTSLRSIIGKEIRPKEVLSKLFSRLESRYLALKSGKNHSMKAEYEQSLYMKDQLCRFKDLVNDTQFEGCIRNVTSMGKLIVEVTNAGMREYNFREIQLLLN